MSKKNCSRLGDSAVGKRCHLLHGDVGCDNMLSAGVLNFSIDINVFSGYVAGAIQPQCAGHGTGTAAAAANVLVFV